MWIQHTERSYTPFALHEDAPIRGMWGVAKSTTLGFASNQDLRRTAAIKKGNYSMYFSLGLDLILILTLTCAIYYRRYRRQDLLVAFLVVNIGVFGLTVALSDMAVGAGFGIGLFGVLSIIRLRSSEINQRDVAYYFASLVIGLLSAMTTPQNIEIGLLGVVIVLVLLVADQSFRRGGANQMRITLDRTFPDSESTVKAVEDMLGATVLSLRIIAVNAVNDSTVVDVVVRNPRRTKVTR